MRKSLFFILLAAMFFAANTADAQFNEEMMGPPMGMGPGGFGGPGGPGGFGGPQMTPEQMAKKQVARLKKELQLSEQQALQIEQLYKDQAVKKQEQRKIQFEKMRQGGQRPDMEAMRAQMEQERKEMDSKIASVLTPEQHQKYLQMQAEREKRQRPAGERGRRPDGAKGHKHNGAQSNHQPGDMKGHMHKAPAGGDMGRMKTELGLTDEQVAKIKKFKSEQRKQNKAETDAALKEILTPEQYQKLKSAY